MCLLNTDVHVKGNLEENTEYCAHRTRSCVNITTTIEELNFNSQSLYFGWLPISVGLKTFEFVARLGITLFSSIPDKTYKSTS